MVGAWNSVVRPRWSECHDSGQTLRVMHSADGLSIGSEKQSKTQG